MLNFRQKISAWFDRVMYLSFLPLIFFLPVGKAVVEIFATVIISCFFFKRMADLYFQVREQTRPVSNPFHFWFQRFLAAFKAVPHPARGAVAFFIFMQLLSTLISPYPHLSWKGFFGKIVEGTVLFYSFIECFNTRRRLGNFLGIFLASIIFVGIDGIFQMIFKFDFIFRNAFTADGRVTACFSHPNDLGSFLALAAPVCLSLTLGAWTGRRAAEDAGAPPVQRSWRGPAFGVAFFLATAGLGLTFSRGAWIGFLAGLLALALIDRRKSYVPVFVGIIFLAVFYPMIGGARNVTFVTDDIKLDNLRAMSRTQTARQAGESKEGLNSPVVRASSASGGDILKDLWDRLLHFGGAGRTYYWGQALEIIGDAPFLGAGLNTYYKLVPEKRYFGKSYPHNCYLQMTAETGLLGLGAFLWVMFVVSRAALRFLRDTAAGIARYLTAGLFAGLVAFWVHGTLDTNFYSLNLAVLMWVVMGWVTAVILVEKKPG